MDYLVLEKETTAFSLEDIIEDNIRFHLGRQRRGRNQSKATNSFRGVVVKVIRAGCLQRAAANALGPKGHDLFLQDGYGKCQG